METTVLPIWKDYYVTLGTEEQYEWYLIAPGNSLLYHGIAHRRPGETTVRVKVNDLCALWMRTQAAKAATSEVFRVVALPSTNVSFSFLYDWSYDPNHDTVSQGMLAPISLHLAKGQLLAFSQYDYDDIDVRCYRDDGTYSDVLITAGTKAQYKNLYGWDFALPYGHTKIYNLVTRLDAGNMSEFVAIEFNGLRYEIDDTCSRYALYYMNAYGGWETLLLRGRVSFSEGYQRRIYTRDFDNSVTTERGKVNFMNEIDVDMVLRTGWLTDAGAANIRHLTGSTWVYLYDMEEKMFTPLVLTDTLVNRKSYRGEGAALVSYSINARIARERVRL